MMPPFKSTEHFLDLITNDSRVKERILSDLVKERYYIAKFLHTSYVDLDEITRVERNMLLKFLNDDIENEQRKLEKARKANQN